MIRKDGVYFVQQNNSAAISLDDPHVFVLEALVVSEDALHRTTTPSSKGDGGSIFRVAGVIATGASC